jgi:tetratricopeptide (TPR) repeat protein
MNLFSNSPIHKKNNQFSTEGDVEELLSFVEQQLRRKQWGEVVRVRELWFYKLVQSLYVDDAQRLNEMAILAADCLHQHHLVARFMHDLGDLQSSQGFYIEAMKTYESSFTQFETVLHDQVSATKSLLMLAIAHRAVGYIKKSKQLALQCIERAEGLDMVVWKAQPLNLLAWIERDQANYEMSLHYFYSALQIIEQHEAHDRIPMLVQEHYSIARVLILMNNLIKAEEHIKASIYWHNLANSTPIGFMAEKLLGDIAYIRKEYQVALSHYHLALDDVQAKMDERRVAECYWDLAKTNFSMKKFAKAFGYARFCLTQYRRLNLMTRSRVIAAIRTQFKSL